MRLQLDGTIIVVNSVLVVVTLHIHITTIIIEVSTRAIQSDSLREVCQHTRCLQLHVRTLSGIKLIQARLTDGTLPIGHSR